MNTEEWTWSPQTLRHGTPYVGGRGVPQIRRIPKVFVGSFGLGCVLMRDLRLNSAIIMEPH